MSATDLSAASRPANLEPIVDPSLAALNPGSYEELHKKTKEVFPMIFEGFKFTLNKMLSNHFQVNHSMTMSSVQPSGYKFGATFIGNNQISPGEVGYLSFFKYRLKPLLLSKFLTFFSSNF
jgi:mitochondrial import receptor subunit TOM40